MRRGHTTATDSTVVLVRDGATVVRASNVIRMLQNGQTLAQAADNLSTSAATLCRFLQACGHEHTSSKGWQ